MSAKPDTEVVHWGQAHEPDRFDLPEAEVYRRAKWLAGLTVLAIIVTVLAIARLMITVFAPPRLVGVTASGWAFSGPVVEFKPTRDMDDRLFDEIYEHAWMRTEQGGLDKALSPYVGGGIIEYLSGLNEARLSRKEPFRTSAVILERRDAAPRTPTFASVMYRTRLNIRVLRGDDNASSVVFFNAVYRKSNPTLENPLGWRLVELKRILPEHFYADEEKARAADVFKMSHP